MKILITGSQGYIGSVLGPYLVARGHEVRGLDTGFYAAPLLYEDSSLQPPVVWRDVRELAVEDFAGFDTVIHLAGLSNDPLGELSPDLTRTINLGGTVRAAVAARDAGVGRFIDFSSCSVYGAGGAVARTEDFPTEPLTEYARCKVYAETAVSQLSSESYAVVSMRNSTVFGPSPRMRFDIVLNNLAGLAWTRGEIRLISDGTPWRPMIHVEDLARAAALLAEAPAELVNRQVFNVGDDRFNYQVREIAEAVARAFPGCRLTVGSSGGDDRSYQVSFAKIRERIGFTCEHDIDAGARELRSVFERMKLTAEIFESAYFTRLKRIRSLIDAGALDANLLWLASSGHDNRTPTYTVGA
jgi:nucleoside-diphosphate-sugar epimerase